MEETGILRVCEYNRGFSISGTRNRSRFLTLNIPSKITKALQDRNAVSSRGNFVDDAPVAIKGPSSVDKSLMGSSRIPNDRPLSFYFPPLARTRWLSRKQSSSQSLIDFTRCPRKYTDYTFSRKVCSVVGELWVISLHAPQVG